MSETNWDEWMNPSPTIDIEIESKGSWPLASIIDINNARIRIENEGGMGVDNYLLASPQLTKCLDVLLPDESETYRSALVKYNIVKKIISVGHNENCAVLLWYRTSYTNNLDATLTKIRVKINNVKYQPITPPEELTDEELLDHLEKSRFSTATTREAVRRLFRNYKTGE